MSYEARGKLLTTLLPSSIREHLPGPNGSDVDLLQGTVLGQVPYVFIRWSWLSFLVSEFALAVVFLAGLIIATKRSRVQVIQSSSLATMCALDEHTRRYLGDLNDLASLEDQAGKMEVRLERSVSGLAMWLNMLKPRRA